MTRRKFSVVWFEPGKEHLGLAEDPLDELAANVAQDLYLQLVEMIERRRAQSSDFRGWSLGSETLQRILSAPGTEPVSAGAVPIPDASPGTASLPSQGREHAFPAGRLYWPGDEIGCYEACEGPEAEPGATCNVCGQPLMVCEC